MVGVRSPQLFMGHLEWANDNATEANGLAPEIVPTPKPLESTVPGVRVTVTNGSEAENGSALSMVGAKASDAFACPSRLDVLNTPRAIRWQVWDDSASECSDGCNLKWCSDGKLAPCCVKRKRARWSQPCEALPFGCEPDAAPHKRFGAKVTDIGAYATPVVEASERCPVLLSAGSNLWLPCKQAGCLLTPVPASLRAFCSTC